ncbi:MAG: glutamate 5-kinase [Planctomycetes bacterium]|nr:glutamate 5-kinase [Planctomycetota bacterium]
MTELVRQEIMTAADLVVVKVGTRVLTHADGTLDDDRVASISGQLARLWQAGRRVVLVSSGAVGAGLGRLGLERRPTGVAQLQAAAAIGQSLLIESYNRTLEPYQLHAAQVLLTAEDLQQRTRYLNVRNTLFALFQCGAVPIINENDTVSVDELQRSFGDNDRLAALVTNLIRAPLLVLLSDIDGLYDGEPSDPKSKIISVVTDIDAASQCTIRDRASQAAIQLGTGGMTSKLQAARIATSAGENVVIANGRDDDVLDKILSGDEVGTLILAEGRSIDSRRRWIGWSARAHGKLLLDAGARSAIESNGRSLLAVGVTAVEGSFSKGDVVAICDASGQEFARGLINYSADEMQSIAGESTERIAQLLGHCPYQEVVHRNNLIVL